MIDLPALKAKVDLLSLVGQDTSFARRPVHSKGLEEWHAPCPLPGCSSQDDGFWVTPEIGRFQCRRCGRSGTAIDYAMLTRDLDFKGAIDYLASLTGGELPTTRGKPQHAPAPIPAYQPPAGDWQEWALSVERDCIFDLWGEFGQAALDYLRRRGLKDDTISNFRLGYSVGSNYGTPLWIPRGVVIPSWAGGEIWYFKIALLPGDRVKCEGSEKDNPHYCEARKPCPTCGKVNKYRGVKGNRTAAIFNAGDLRGAELALFCEGEFDCMIAWQEVGDVLPVATLGAAGNRLDLATWGPYLLGLQHILSTYDTDQAGKAGAAYLASISDCVQACSLPEGAKDINDYTQAGGDLWPWLKDNLDRLGVLEALGVPYDANPGEPEPVELLGAEMVGVLP